ncbi:MAG: T9SS type A sorting domain-containing protein, partial [Bacteroidota bacterium]
VNNTLGDNFEINNNTIQLVKNGDSGIYFGAAAGGNNAQINGNTINLEASTSNYAIYVASVYNNMKIIGNEITGSGRYGININGSATAGNKGLIANNMISLNGTTAGNIDIGSSDYWNVYNNSLHYYGSTSSTSVILLYMNTSADYTSIINNIFSNQCSGTYSLCVKLDDDDTFDIELMDNNDYYFAGTDMGYWDGVYKTSYADWIAVSGETNSQNVDPKFTSDTDLRLVDVTTTLGELGTNLVSVTDDIDGTARANPPTIGAYEVPPSGGASITLTATFTTFTSTLSTPTSSQSFTVEGTNLTADISVSVPAEFQISEDDAAWGSGPVTLTESGGTVSTTILYVRFNPSATGHHTGDVSASSTGATTRDEAVTGNCALTGSYTVGGVTPDYATIANAVTELTTVGISGAVTFNLRTGTFTEQILLPAITGASATDTITFQAESGDADDVIWEYNSPNSSNNYNIKLDGADYIVINKLTLNTLNSSYARLIDITNDATYNKVMNCKLTGYATTSFTSTNFSLIYSVGSTFRDNGNEVTNNTFTNGTYGIEFNGNATPPYETGTVIGNNTFINQSNKAINLIYQDAPKMNSNTIITNSTRTDWHGIHVEYCDNAMELKKNKITANSTTDGYGFRTYECDGTAGNRVEMSNNMISIGNNNYTYGMYIQTAAYLNIYYNSIEVSSSNSTVGYNNAFYHDGGISSANMHNNIKNNIFVNATVDDDAWAVYIKETDAIDAMDYNDLYWNGGYLGKFSTAGGDTIKSLTTWKSRTGFGTNSISGDPLYTSSTDLHILEGSPCIDKATAIAGLNDDIDGDSRATDIGGDEYDGGLPVELLFFNASVNGEGYVDLKWRTATEINNDYFTVERIKNPQGFENPEGLMDEDLVWETVDIVDGAGNSNSILHYFSTDNDPYTGTSYYRLKQTDFDGAFEYSDIVAVKISRDDGLVSVNVFPNPNNGKFIIEIESFQNDKYNITVENIYGQLIYSESHVNASDVNVEHVVLPESLKGIYMLKISTNTDELIKKIIIY